MEYKNVCFIYRHPDYALDGIRSSLGLAVENMYAFGVVLDVAIPQLDKPTQQSIEMLRNMEGEVYSTLPANVEINDFKVLTLEELGQKLRKMTHIIPFGLK